jgi:hypothetical protein
MIPAPRVIEGPDKIRRFDDATLQSSIERALKSLGSDKKIAAIAHGEIVNGVGQADLSLVFRPNAESPWTVCATGYKKFSGDWGGGVQVVWSK